MGNCWTHCCATFRRGANRIQRGGGGSRYFRSSTTGEHYTIEFENLVESDEGETSEICPRPISEEEMGHLKEYRYAAISDKQTLIDAKLNAELRPAREPGAKLDAAAAAAGHQRKNVSGPELEAHPQNAKAQSEAFRGNRLSSETNVVTPNTENSWDFTSKTRSTNDDGTSLDLEWEDEEGMNRMGQSWERSRTEEDILRAALRPGGKVLGSGPASASEDSNALEWENDFISAHNEDDEDDDEFEGFVNPVLDTPSEDGNDLEKQDR
ncbi:AP-1 complex-associated regulatory protein isoform X2 [Denticeps clupeoides]|uniref:AP-1 complex-associated regulatory protein isoform X2 n=1 Tax=Denticeps clupeoides TaxID=299321 RepID=UPI0010A42022|nr:AP-1 complex-associated regulatory protein isoform X2 [Denticeps clupeoides]